MLEIIFNGVVLIGLIALFLALLYQEEMNTKRRQEEYFDNLAECITEGVYLGLERWSISECRYNEGKC